jgi:hypothetical protein
MNVLAGLHGLDDTSDLASIFGCCVSNREVLQCQLVAERNRLLRARAERRVVGEIPANALCARFEINDCDTDIICSVMG